MSGDEGMSQFGGKIHLPDEVVVELVLSVFVEGAAGWGTCLGHYQSHNSELTAVAPLVQNSRKGRWHSNHEVGDIILTARAVMNIQSPTTLLSSIQSMKTKLKSDKRVLMDLKQDFSCFVKKKEGSRQYDEVDALAASEGCRPAEEERIVCLDRPPKGDMLKLKKEHQKEMARVKETHQKQLQKLAQIHRKEMEDMQSQYKRQLQQQASYISILQEQVNSAPLSSRSNHSATSHQQYDTVINKLLQSNTKLHEEVTQLQRENERWRIRWERSQPELGSNRSRLKFGRGKKDGISLSCYESEGLRAGRPRSCSVLEEDKENRESFNGGDEWEDLSIDADEGKMRTIRQFEKSALEGGN